MQFEGLTNSTMPVMVWKPWATPKCKIFTWLVLQNRVWTADRLECWDGKIVEIVSFATKLKNPPPIYNYLAVSQKEFGSTSRNGLDSLMSIRRGGMKL
jgi:hypothetical protein